VRRKLKNTKFNLGLFYSAFGALFIILGILIVVIMNSSFKKFAETAVSTQAVIYDIQSYRIDNNNDGTSTRYNVYVEFTTEDNETIKTELKSYSSDMYIGKNIELYYDPLNPYRVEVENVLFQRIFLSTFCGVGLLFFIIGILLLKRNFMAKNKIKRLVEGGYYVMAEIIEINKNTNAAVNGSNPFTIICKYTELDKNYMFKSKSIYFDPSAFLNGYIKVWLDRADYTNYYVDIDNIIQN